HRCLTLLDPATRWRGLATPNVRQRRQSLPKFHQHLQRFFRVGPLEISEKFVQFQSRGSLSLASQDSSGITKLMCNSACRRYKEFHSWLASLPKKGCSACGVSWVHRVIAFRRSSRAAGSDASPAGMSDLADCGSLKPARIVFVRKEFFTSGAISVRAHQGALNPNPSSEAVIDRAR